MEYQPAPKSPLDAEFDVSIFRLEEYVDWQFRAPGERSFFDCFGMRKVTFNLLLERLLAEGWLEVNQHRIQPREALAIFMHICGSPSRDPVKYAAPWYLFRYHPTTISQQFQRVLTALRNLSNANIRPNNNNPHSTIVDNQKFNPMFLDCIGAVDAATVTVNREDMATSAMHCTFAVDFDLMFTFFKSDCEGSAHDERVFLNIVSNPEGNFPAPKDGQFYIVDSRFPLHSGYRPPYGGVRQRFKSIAPPPQDDQELFNSRHSNLLNIPIACAAIHNFIRVNDSDDFRFRNERPCSVVL